MASLPIAAAAPARIDRRSLALSLGIPIGVGFLLGWLGADPLASLPKIAAVAAGILTAIVGWLSADLGTRLVAPWGRRRGWPLWLVLAIGVVASGPLAVPATFAVREIFTQLGFMHEGISGLAHYTPQRAVEGVVGPLLLWTSLNLALFRLGVTRFGYRPEDPGEPPAREAADALLRLVRPQLRGPLIAVQAEQHYVRIFTARGSDLVLHRFGDAVRLLDGVPGTQVHRSWWVAKAAVDGVQPDPSRLRLTNGLLVPVGRTYALEARRAGLCRAARR